MRTRYLIPSLLVFLVWGSAFAQPAEQLFDSPHVTVRWYSVPGRTLEEVRRAFGVHGPKDPKGTRRHAVTRWSVEWHWYDERSGSNRFDAVRLTPSVEVVLPRWPAYQNASLEARREWDRYFKALVGHEQRHVESFLDHHVRIATLIREAYAENPGLNRGEATNIAKRVVEEMQQFDNAYDARTDHGRSEGVRLCASGTCPR